MAGAMRQQVRTGVAGWKEGGGGQHRAERGERLVPSQLRPTGHRSDRSRLLRLRPRHDDVTTASGRRRSQVVVADADGVRQVRRQERGEARRRMVMMMQLLGK